MEQQLAEWIAIKDNLFTSCEYASKACQRTGVRDNVDGQEFNHNMQHPNETVKVVLNGLMPYLDDYVMNVHDPFVEDFVWSINDSRHTESVSKELTETDVPKSLLPADKDVIQAVRTSSASAASDPTRVAAYSAGELVGERRATSGGSGRWLGENEGHSEELHSDAW